MTTTTTMPNQSSTDSSTAPKVPMNQVILGGNLTADPELRYTPGGKAVLTFSIAHNNKYKTGEGEEKEDTCFLEATVFGEKAEALVTKLKRGSFTRTTGVLKQDRWETDDQQKRSKHKMVAFKIEGYNKEERFWQEL